MERKSAVNWRLSDTALLEMAEQCEGFVGYAYDDKDPKSLTRKTFITPDLADTVQGTLTIGYGHTRSVKPGDRVTRDEALALLRSDARDAEGCVHRHVKVPLTQGEFDGAVDLFFNIGPGSMPSERWPQGKDGIACLGKSGHGRPSTLLTKLNDGDYTAAAECFTQWRNKGSIWEWGLLKRRIRFMLVFMGLPIVRAMNALPNAMPLTDQARFELVQKCIGLAREEADDRAAMTPAVAPAPEPKPAPEPIPEPPAPQEELVLDKPIDEPVDAHIEKPAPAPIAIEPSTPPAEAPPVATNVEVNTPTANVEVKTEGADATVKVETPDAKHPVNSWTIWGGFALYFLPDLAPFAERLLTVEIAGPIGHVIRGAALMILIFGRLAASMPVSIKAKAKMPALRKVT